MLAIFTNKLITATWHCIRFRFEVSSASHEGIYTLLVSGSKFPLRLTKVSIHSLFQVRSFFCLSRRYLYTPCFRFEVSSASHEGIYTLLVSGSKFPLPLTKVSIHFSFQVRSFLCLSRRYLYTPCFRFEVSSASHEGIYTLLVSGSKFLLPLTKVSIHFLFQVRSFLCLSRRYLYTPCFRFEVSSASHEGIYTLLVSGSKFLLPLTKVSIHFLFQVRSFLCLSRRYLYTPCFRFEVSSASHEGIYTLLVSGSKFPLPLTKVSIHSLFQVRSFFCVSRRYLYTPCFRFEVSSASHEGIYTLLVSGSKFPLRLTKVSIHSLFQVRSFLCLSRRYLYTPCFRFEVSSASHEGIYTLLVSGSKFPLPLTKVSIHSLFQVRSFLCVSRRYLYTSRFRFEVSSASHEGIYTLLVSGSKFPLPLTKVSIHSLFQVRSFPCLSRRYLYPPCFRFEVSPASHEGIYTLLVSGSKFPLPLTKVSIPSLFQVRGFLCVSRRYLYTPCFRFEVSSASHEGIYTLLVSGSKFPLPLTKVSIHSLFQVRSFLCLSRRYLYTPYFRFEVSSASHEGIYTLLVSGSKFPLPLTKVSIHSLFQVRSFLCLSRRYLYTPCFRFEVSSASHEGIYTPLISGSKFPLPLTKVSIHSLFQVRSFLCVSRRYLYTPCFRFEVSSASHEGIYTLLVSGSKFPLPLTKVSIHSLFQVRSFLCVSRRYLYTPCFRFEVSSASHEGIYTLLVSGSKFPLPLTKVSIHSLFQVRSFLCVSRRYLHPPRYIRRRRIHHPPYCQHYCILLVYEKTRG